jgi:hypothetical protein
VFYEDAILNYRMDSSRTSLPNVDRANSSLFKRYLEEQHKSVLISNTTGVYARPIHSTLHITHTEQQHDTYAITSNNRPQPVLAKRKNAPGRKSSADTSKQRNSHTSRFMRRLQRQNKTGETLANVRKSGEFAAAFSLVR